jgi:hypothetical protein
VKKILRTQRLLQIPRQTRLFRSQIFGSFWIEKLQPQNGFDVADTDLGQIDGAMDAKGVYTAAAQGSTAGFVKATVAGLGGTARVRVVEPLPWSFDFDNAAAEAPPAWWTGAPGKVFQRTVEGAGKVLMRPRDDTVGRRAKVFLGQPGMTGYTVEADVRGADAPAARRAVDRRGVRPVLFGNGQSSGASMVRPTDDRARAVRLGCDMGNFEAASINCQTARRACAARCGRQPIPNQRRGPSRRWTRSRTRWGARAFMPTASPTSISTT